MRISTILFFFLLFSIACSNKESCYYDKACEAVEISFNDNEIKLENAGYGVLLLKGITLIMLYEEQQFTVPIIINEELEIKRRRSHKIDIKQYMEKNYPRLTGFNPLLNAINLEATFNYQFPDCDILEKNSTRTCFEILAY